MKRILMLCVAICALVFIARAVNKPPCTSSSITSQPPSQAVAEGSNAVFTVTASGSAPLYYQWSINNTNLTNGGNISGATNNTLTISNVLTNNAGNYTVLVYNDCGSVTSSVAVLTVLLVPPYITTQPASQTLFVGDTVIFSVTAIGPLPLSYQWSSNGTNIMGATNMTLTLTNIQLSQAGNYVVLVTNVYGSVLSSNAALNVIQPTPCITPPSGLAGLWRAESNALDSAGTNNGTMQGGAGYTNGLVGQAFSFDGVSGNISIPDSPSLDAFTTSITIELWLKSSQSNSDWKGIVAKGNSSWQLQATPRANTVNFTVSVSAGALSGSQNVNDGQWHHVAAVYDGTNMFLYVDGMLDVSQPATGLIPQNNDPLCIGANAKAYVRSCGCNKLGYFFNGFIDEVSIYNRPLSSDEIAAIYNAGDNGKCVPPPGSPLITTQPTNQTVIMGSNATFSVTATGTPPLSYQWCFNSGVLANATNAGLILTNVQPKQAGIYSVVVSNGVGTVTSSYAVLRVWNPSSVVAWGYDGNGQIEVPVDLTNAVAVAGGFYHSLALKGDGKVVGWGFDDDGEVDVPSDLTNVVAIAGGGYHSLALKDDGTVVGWGFDGYGQTDVPSDLTNMVAIAGGGYHSLALKDDGTVVGWGFDDDGETNVPSDLTNVVAIAAGGNHSLALKGDGKVVGWGFDGYGETNVPSGLTNVVAIAAGQFHSLALGYAPPRIATQPQSQTVAVGDDVTFNVVVVGSSPLNYQWYFNAAKLANATNRTLTLSGVSTNDAGGYHVVITNKLGSVTSSNAVLTVSLPPSITMQPVGRTAVQGANVNFTVAAAGTPPLGYQWLQNGLPLSDDGIHVTGSATTSLTLNGVLDSDAGNYSVVVTNGVGGVVSTDAALTVIVPPLITAQPADQTVIQGTGATFSVTVSTNNTMPLSYQWRFQGTNILAGATNVSLTLMAVQTTNAGHYLVVVTNRAGSVTSSNAVLTVLVPPTVSITNPVNNTMFNPPTNITINATVSGYSGTVTQVQFFVGTKLLAIDANAPYSLVWSNAPQGLHALTAIATDNLGLTATSSVVNVTISTNLLPIADAYVWDLLSFVNYGTNIVLECQTGTSIIGDNRDVYFKFDLGNISTNINRVQLRVFSALSGAGTVTNTVYSVTDTSWVENNITWINKPAQVTALTTNTMTGTTGSWYLFDVTGYIKSQQAAGTNIISLALHDPSKTGLMINVNSKENSTNKPMLLIVTTNLPLTVSIANPLAGSVFTAQTNITISATAADTDANVTQVEFFQGTISLGVVTSVPYSLTWSNVASGPYALTAVASDDAGLTVTSSVVNVSVVNNLLPVADAHVRDGTNADTNFGMNTILEVESSDPGDNRDAYLKFDLSNISTNISSATLNVFAGNNSNGGRGQGLAEFDLFAVANTSWGELTITWNNKPARGGMLAANTVARGSGWHQFDVTGYIKSQQAAGQGVVSLAFHDSRKEDTLINVNSRENTNPPVLTVAFGSNNPVSVSLTSPADNAAFSVSDSIDISATASDGVGTISQVQFYQGTTSLGIVTNPPYGLAWSNAASGRYALTAVARDTNGWVAVSRVVNILVDVPPAVTLTNPADNDYFVQGSNICLGASASDAGGAVTQVEFFQGTTSLGVVPNAPYVLAWSNAPAGLYVLTACAMDNNGITTTSAPVTIHVLDAPMIITQPASQAVFQGSNAIFSVTALGIMPLHYQWIGNGTILAGQTNATLTLPGVQMTDAGNYHVVVTNTVGSVTSLDAVLTVIMPSFITAQPTNQIVLEGDTATFTVGVASGYTFNYQWFHNGTAMPGKTGISLVISGVAVADVGDYTVTVFCNGSMATSIPAQLGFHCCTATEQFRPAHILGY